MSYKLFERIDIHDSKEHNEFKQPWPDEEWPKEKVQSYFETLVNTEFYTAEYKTTEIDEQVITLVNLNKQTVDVIAVDEKLNLTVSDVREMVTQIEHNWND